MSYSPTLRRGTLPRSLYLPSSFYEDSIGDNVRQVDSNQSPTMTDSSSYVKQYSTTHVIPALSTNAASDTLPQSHFSPSTPVLEQGFEKYGLDKYEHKQDGSLDVQCPCHHGRRRFRNTVLPCIMAAFMLVLIANVIVLDIRMISLSDTRDRAAANLKAASSDRNSKISGPLSSSSPSSSISSSTLSPTNLPPPSSPNANANDSNLASLSDIPSQAAGCISQFLPSIGTTPSDPESYCTQCVPALQSIPENWFVQESGAGPQGKSDLQAVSAVLDFCNSTTQAGSTTPAQQTSA